MISFLTVNVKCKPHIYQNNFTIIASCFLSYCSPLIILGVTNPFFAKTLEHWPHIVRIGELSSKGHGQCVQQLISSCDVTVSVVTV